MGFFENLFKKDTDLKKVTKEQFGLYTGYTPVFTDVNGGLYEMELTRACVHQFATMCAKLKPVVTGSAYKDLKIILENKPNPYMDTYKFLYKIATILATKNTAFIIPIENDFGRIEGYYPIMPDKCEVVEADGEPFLIYTFANGKKGAIEARKVGILNNYLYKSDFFGENNNPLNLTLQMMQTNNEGIINAVKNSATIRFFARIGVQLKDADIKKARDNFNALNLSSDNQTGLMLVDNKFLDVKQLESKPFTTDEGQIKQIKENVFNYFGTSENILQNRYSEDEWNAFYEGKIEPFAIQLSLAMSNMTFTNRELAFGNSITFTANRLQYASNVTKLNISTQLFDRALISRNEVMDIWQMAHVPDGDKYYIRKEYAEVNKLDADIPTPEIIVGEK